MSIQAVGWAMEQQDEMPATVKLVLVAICNHADHRTGYCWLDTQTIADEAACVPRSVYRFVGALVRNGYVRKEKRRGGDGKQRANDYWVLLDRPPAKWDWNARLHGENNDLAEDETGEEITTSDASMHTDATTSGDRVTPTTPGETGEKSPEPIAEKPSESLGPGDNRVTQESLAEPSKTKPKESLRHDFSAAPRSYRPALPAAPQQLGSAVNQSKQIFVYEGTRAWDAWCAFKLKESGVHWTLSRTTVIDGKQHSGWWFPSLFPPKENPPEPAPESLATEAELQEFANTS